MATPDDDTPKARTRKQEDYRRWRRRDTPEEMARLAAEAEAALGEPSDAEDATLRNFRVNLATARNTIGNSQQLLAARLTRAGLTMNQAGVSRLEQGGRDPSLSELSIIARVLGVTVDSLIGPPEEFQKNLMGNMKQAGFNRATERITGYGKMYEHAAEELAEYVASQNDGSLPDDIKDKLRPSCLAVVANAYNSENPWREKYGIELDKSDPAYGLKS